MITTMEGRTRGVSLRVAIVWVLLAFAFVLGLSFYKDAKLNSFARQSVELTRARQGDLLNRFQASFYFYYADQFLPEIRKTLDEVPHLEQIQIVSSSGSLLFDSLERSSAVAPAPRRFEAYEETLKRLGTGDVNVIQNGFGVNVTIKSGQYLIIYTLVLRELRNQILYALLIVLSLLSVVTWIADRMDLLRVVGAISSRMHIGLRHFMGLRLKFLLTIVLVNLITGLIVFVTLSELQTRERSAEIEKESALFSRFATAQVISDYSNFFYFYYADKFVPGIKSLISTNENLIGIRIISKRTNTVLFDSEVALAEGAVLPVNDAPKSDLPAYVEAELRQRDTLVRSLGRGGEKIFSVIQTYRGEDREPVFFVEYLFSFSSLQKSIAAIRRQIIIDLVPALAIGLVIAALFAQLLISPIRKLVAALQRVSSGDYDVSVGVRRHDEIGELVQAFNLMTTELKKKKELRKFLSDSTYRQVMEAVDGQNNTRLGGTRVEATVLFSDIRNFVAHCENREAEEVTSMLNEYFSEMVEVVHKYGGEVDKFIGDGVLAVFYPVSENRLFRAQDSLNEPSSEATAMQAIFCGLEMHARLKEFNHRKGWPERDHIQIGVGITHGEVISGPIGSKDRMDFTVIGDVVNLASRIEKFSKLGTHTRVVFSEHVLELVNGLVDCVRVHHGEIRGKEEEVSVYELIQVRDLDVLIGNLESLDPTVKCKSLELLGQSRNEKAVPYVLATLKDTNEEVRFRAILALSKLSGRNNTAVLDALFHGLSMERVEKLVSALVSVIGRVCTDDRVLDVKLFLDSPNERIVANTVEALGQVRTPKCIELILPKLSSMNNRVKANAAMALFEAGHIEVVELLTPMLMHSAPLMRSSAAFALGELTMIAGKDWLLDRWQKEAAPAKVFLGELQQCVPLLVSLLKDHDSMVKRQAIIALGKIKDRSAVLPIIDNIDLDKDTAEMISDVSQALRSIGSHRLVREVVSRLS